MIKNKLISCTCVLIILGTAGSFTYATPAIRNVDTTKYEIVKTANQSLQIITPEREQSVSSSTKLVLEFTAPKDTKIKVRVYHNTSIEKGGENYVLINDPLLVDVGILQRGWAEIELKRGSNKIEITAEYKDGTAETVRRYVAVKGVEDVKRRILEGKITSEFLKDITGNK
ncbi:hypothetical protein [Alkaliphilus hydrothermalis]|uniref:Anaerobic selenocysteine-containing dehydrogenase n=1 Tax=Alkaliphilus hydrothermalis TaxID=1482730 RepID=A0ABS2NRZ2_9FIRM|nr:hypothetical protein [Alkaliphilus hydrothermalis]MBM7615542.1 anaerobic selenocysteine-containing dehydrogenase [Alkaliphilus hydrothermalis]